MNLSLLIVLPDLDSFMAQKKPISHRSDASCLKYNILPFLHAWFHKIIVSHILSYPKKGPNDMVINLCGNAAGLRPLSVFRNLTLDIEWFPHQEKRLSVLAVSLTVW